MTKGKKTALLIATLVIAAPLLLWLDVWLAIKFGNWVESVGGTYEASATMGVFAFIVLVAAQAVATAIYAFSKETK